MKITRFHIQNYRGIRDARAENLSAHPFVVVTGRNGTGKSLVLEALAAIWAGEINLPDLVGPYARSLSVELAVRLSETEYCELEAWLEETGQAPISRRPEHVLHAVATTVQDTGQYLERDAVIKALQSKHFAQRFSFANVDLLSARRQPSLGTEIGVDLHLLDAGQNALQRRQMMQDEIRWKNTQHMPDVGSYLTALDYREYVYHRDGLDDLGEYERLQHAFQRATGKTISRPSFDHNTGRPEIIVEVPSGIQHGLADLSNGEREMIGMFYYISQLASRGGVLLLDEPEKHLHPTLQNAVLQAITSIAGQGQALIVTHSPTIVAAVPQEQICSVQGAWETRTNQLRWASDAGQDYELLAELGINTRDMLQMDAVLIVEGPDDAQRLIMLFPEELSRVKVIEAGGRARAVYIAEAMAQVNIGLPHLCVVDRDYLSKQDVSNLEEKGIFVWDARMLENVMLSAPLIAEETHCPEIEIGAIIHACAEDLKSTAIKTFAEQRVLNLPNEDSKRENTGIEDFIQNKIETWQNRLDKQATIEDEVRDEIVRSWDENFHTYVDGKQLLGAVHAKIKKHSTKAVFAESLLHTARKNPDVMPAEFVRFKEAIAGITGRPDPVFPAVKTWSNDLDETVKRVLLQPEPSRGLNDRDGTFEGCIGMG